MMKINLEMNHIIAIDMMLMSGDCDAEATTTFLIILPVGTDGDAVGGGDDKEDDSFAMADLSIERSIQWSRLLAIPQVLANCHSLPGFTLLRRRQRQPLPTSPRRPPLLLCCCCCCCCVGLLPTATITTGSAINDSFVMRPAER